MQNLRPKHIRKFAVKLNQPSSILKTWTHLAQQFFDDYQIPIEELKTKHINASPGRNLLNALSTSKPELSVEEFKKISIELNRKDIAMLLDAVGANELLQNIGVEVQER